MVIFSDNLSANPVVSARMVVRCLNRFLTFVLFLFFTGGIARQLPEVEGLRPSRSTAGAPLTSWSTTDSAPGSTTGISSPCPLTPAGNSSPATSTDSSRSDPAPKERPLLQEPGSAFPNTRSGTPNAKPPNNTSGSATGWNYQSGQFPSIS